MTSLSTIGRGSVLLAAVVCAVASAGEWSASPGIVNFAEGKVALNGQPVAPETGAAILSPGQTLQTEQGRAELLLTPGVYLRVGENSIVKMDAMSDTAIKVELVRGEAIAEVDRVGKTQRLDIIDNGADAHLDHNGIYLFDAGKPAVIVYDGRTRVEDDRRSVEVAKGEQLLLNAPGGKAQKLGSIERGPLYTWSEERAGYASQVSEWTAESLVGLDGQPTYTEGWYWNPWFKSWAYLPEKGYVKTPFGYGLYAAQEPHYRAPSYADFRN